MNQQQESKNDKLRARFTKWLEKMIYHSKISYIRKLSREIEVISLDEMKEYGVIDNALEEICNNGLLKQKCFEFEEEKLARAFLELPLMRQRILRMLFVEEKKPYEISEELHCSIQYIYNQRSLALKALRKKYLEDGEIS